jgi:hypothetical protein
MNEEDKINRAFNLDLSYLVEKQRRDRESSKKPEENNIDNN